VSLASVGLVLCDDYAMLLISFKDLRLPSLPS
jgi:hypothetical protein